MNKNYVYENERLKIRIDNRGDKGNYTVLERKNAVVIIPVSELNKTVLLSEFRYPINEICLNFPMGFVDDGENSEEAARRELEEETNLISEIKEIGYFHPAPGLTPQKVWVFIAKVADENFKNISSENSGDEIKKSEIIDISEIEVLIKNSKITDGFTLSAYSIFKSYISTV